MTDPLVEALHAAVPPSERMATAAKLHVLADLLEEGVELGDAVKRVYTPDPDDETEQRLAYARRRVAVEMARRGIKPPDAGGH